jgi:hypothetical protein
MKNLQTRVYRHKDYPLSRGDEGILDAFFANVVRSHMIKFKCLFVPY